jgi:hypothetical protein
MSGWESDLDRWLTTPPEPKVVGKCAHCDAELYANCGYVHDRNENEWYCDTDCFVAKLREADDLVTDTITK